MSKRLRVKQSSSDAGQLTLLSAALPASHPQSPESDEVARMTAGCGLTFCAWCVRSIPCGCFARTLLTYLASTLREYGSANGLRYGFTISDSRSSRSCLVLKTLARRTNESGSGLWPTPTVCGNHNRKGASAHSGDGLSTAVKNWNTPIAGDADGSRKGKGKGRPNEGGLSFQVKNWTTLTARDWRSIRASEATHNHNTRPLGEQVGLWVRDTNSTNGSSRETSQSRSLNPRWELQLMGLPADWLDGVEPE